MKRRALLAAVFLAAFAARGEGAVVTLKDGSSLRGKVVGLDRIVRIDYSEPVASPLPGLAAPPEIVAAGRRRRFVSLGLGFVEPAGRVDFHSIGGGSADNGDLGMQFGAQYVYYLTPRLGAGLDFDYFDRSGTLSERLFPAAAASVSGDTSLILAVLRYSFADRGMARPFVLLGAGGAWNTIAIDVRPSIWADTGTRETRRLVDDGAWVPAGSVRLGLDFDVDALEPGVLTFEAGWTGLASARYAATPRGQAQGLSGTSGPLSIVSFTARYGWRF